MSPPEGPKLAPLTSAEYIRQRDAQRASADPALLAAALAAGMDPDMPFDINHRSTPLICAIEASPSSPECARMLLAAGADPNFSGRGSSRPIESALSRSHNSPAAMEAARAVATDPRLRPWPGEHLLSLSFYAPELVADLARAGFDPSAPCPPRSFPDLGEGFPSFEAATDCLGQALSYGVVDSGRAARALVAAGADANGSPGAFSPLGCAILLGTADAARALLDCGADPRRPILAGLDALGLAALAAKRRPRLSAHEILPLVRERHGSLREREALDRSSGSAAKSSGSKGL